MQLEIQKFLYDIQKACALIEEFTSGRDLDAFRDDEMLRAAVERKFEIIGEALNQAMKIQPDLSSKITNWHEIVHFRHVLAHRYYIIDPAIVWGIIKDDMPILA